MTKQNSKKNFYSEKLKTFQGDAENMVHHERINW